MKRLILIPLVCGLWVLGASAQAQKSLDIYFIDVEGGQATLFVTPTGQSMLIDTGFPGNGDRDLNRVLATIKQAKLKRLDFLLVTHYHTDHVGNAAAIAAKVPVTTFIDHGETVETTADAKALYSGYVKGRGRARHMLAKPGAKILLGEVEFTIVSAGGAHLARPSIPDHLVRGEVIPLALHPHFAVCGHRLIIAVVDDLVGAERDRLVGRGRLYGPGRVGRRLGQCRNGDEHGKRRPPDKSRPQRFSASTFDDAPSPAYRTSHALRQSPETPPGRCFAKFRRAS